MLQLVDLDRSTYMTYIGASAQFYVTSGRFSIRVTWIYFDGKGENKDEKSCIPDQ